MLLLRVLHLPVKILLSYYHYYYSSSRPRVRYHFEVGRPGRPITTRDRLRRRNKPANRFQFYFFIFFIHDTYRRGIRVLNYNGSCTPSSSSSCTAGERPSSCATTMMMTSVLRNGGRLSVGAGRKVSSVLFCYTYPAEAAPR